MPSVSVSELIDKMKLVNLTPEIDVEDIKITQPDINRPALQMAGFLEHFETGRVQIIGFVEYTYMEKLDSKVKKERYENILCDDTPCYVFCRDLQPDKLFIEMAEKYHVPLLMTSKATSTFMAPARVPIRWLNGTLMTKMANHHVLIPNGCLELRTDLIL